MAQNSFNSLGLNFNPKLSLSFSLISLVFHDLDIRDHESVIHLSWCTLAVILILQGQRFLVETFDVRSPITLQMRNKRTIVTARYDSLLNVIVSFPFYFYFSKSIISSFSLVESRSLSHLLSILKIYDK